MTRPDKPETLETSVAGTDRRSLFERVAGWLDSQDWHYDAYPEKQMITFGISSREVSYRVLLDISREMTSALDLHTVLERVLVLSTGSIGVERASLLVLGHIEINAHENALA